MRSLLTIIVLLSVESLSAQVFQGGFFPYSSFQPGMAYRIPVSDSTSNKKWSITKFSGIAASYIFSKNGSASVLSAPIGIQLNRRLNDNLYAFGALSVMPSYISSNNFLPGGYSKFNGAAPFYKPNSFAMPARAELGLMYVNDAKTFSISGSIGVERSTYPVFYSPANRQPVIKARQ